MTVNDDWAAKKTEKVPLKTNKTELAPEEVLDFDSKEMAKTLRNISEELRKKIIVSDQVMAEKDESAFNTMEQYALDLESGNKALEGAAKKQLWTLADSPAGENSGNSSVSIQVQGARKLMQNLGVL